ncbi:tigger transposable element-derived protein 6-like [Rhizophagus irregularis DAOM 181602=DAOM 197198]|nr:tigger transposable element-derived protein 6-like [Rhizophagus irregularis DAOM 181602=DAOM 197198]
MPQLQRKRKITHDSLQPKKRVVLTHAQKRQLCLDSQKTSRLTQQELAAIYQIKQNTVSDILKNKDKWLLVNPDSEEANKQRERPPCFPQVEEALALWLTNALAAGVIINGDILREKAKIFARGFEIDNFTASNGWLEKFKQRHHLKEYVKWGEANSAPLETLEEERRKLREIIKDYDLNNVFNCDETADLYSHIPKSTNITWKKKEELPVNYYWNSTAWMQVSIWNDYLTKLDARMRLQRRKILLIVDNAPVHVINENLNLTNVAVHFLPPNTTAHLQPCDAGIINSFKAQYRKLLIRNRIEAYEISQELNKGATPLNIHDAINFSSDAWNSVSQRTISNCWHHTGILPQDDMDESDDETDDDDDQAIRDEMELQDLIDQLPFNDPMNVEEFLHIDDFLKGNEGLTDDEIISMVKSNNKPEIDPNEGPMEIISKREALGHLDNLVVFFEYSSDVSVNPSELSILQKLRHQVLKSYINSLKQITLDNFVQTL